MGQRATLVVLVILGSWRAISIAVLSPIQVGLDKVGAQPGAGVGLSVFRQPEAPRWPTNQRLHIG
jgi:hypothetical protein